MNIIRLLSLAPVSMVAMAGGYAQSTLVIPPGLATTEAISAGTMPGFSARYRQQILVSDAVLAPMRSKQLVGLRFRRDDLFGKAFQQAALFLAARG